MAGLKFFDPACGSGNFLTETYISLRRLENKVIDRLTKGQIVLGEMASPVKVNIHQFYGIEINDFACVVAKTAMWVAELQMMRETRSIVEMNLDFLPLKSYVNIVEGNALRMDWQEVLPSSECNYIMGNPPFVGARLMKAGSEQKEDVAKIFAGWKNAGNLDYVCCWYKKACEYMKNTSIRAALVSTNSVSQGESVATLWKPLFQEGIKINFAYRTFVWNSESNNQAHVHCVIIGFSYIGYSKVNNGAMEKANTMPVIYSGEQAQTVSHINAYLVEADDVFIETRKKSVSQVPAMVFGNMANDGGNLFLDEDEYNSFIEKNPNVEKYIKPFLGAYEFINKKKRFCLWLVDASPNEIKQMPDVLTRIKTIREMRASSSRAGTRKLADVPALFGEIRQPDTDYLLIPRHSSQNRRYIPIGYFTKDTICGDANMLIPDASLYLFGVITSNVHMAWVRTVCGRIKSDYRYSKDIVYNNFPWPTPTEDQRAKIEKTAQGILDARAKYLDSSLADLYDEVLMPPELRKAHQANDRAVMEAYGFWGKLNTESECVAQLMKLYQQLVENEAKK